MTVGACAVAGTLITTAPFQSEAPRVLIWRSCETGTLRGWLRQSSSESPFRPDEGALDLGSRCSGDMDRPASLNAVRTAAILIAPPSLSPMLLEPSSTTIAVGRLGLAGDWGAVSAAATPAPKRAAGKSKSPSLPRRFPRINSLRSDGRCAVIPRSIVHSVAENPL